MGICACGSAIHDKGGRCARCSALDVLELGVGATDDEIKAKYRMLVKVWHPDRFVGDGNLMQAAEEKSKHINAAFNLLSSLPRPSAGYKPQWPESKEPTATAKTPATPPRPFTGRDSVNRPTNHAAVPPTPPASGPSGNSPMASVPQTSSGWNRVLRYAVIIAGVSLARYFWPSGGTGSNTTATNGGETLAPLSTSHVMETFAPEASTVISTSSSKKAKPTRTMGAHTTNESPPASNTVFPYFTIGSTREQVLAIQGTPTAFSQDKLEYGASEVYLRGGKVVNWKIWPELNPLKAKLIPTSAVSASPGYFTVGSTRDEVLAVQGTPTGFTDNMFEYGASEVYFIGGKVVSWKIWPGLNPLRAKLR